MSGFPSRVKAVLGPTNTGKTHLAIERMLAHSSGVIGFPLRLLARENYDRMVARKGAKNVALITGEEKIVPPDARWFSCTVEAMPLDRTTEFLAVDEIQLCADPDRGHVFTERLLHARGLVETMFLGAETIRPLLQRLVPQAEVETRPRLSQLTFTGPEKLVRLPPRSAVVAFSASEVYAIAELIRRRRGGCAVVMGRLSPRTRNAQVALYQEKEVDFLVATDAIGMGLNMDVDHVAFARLGKFDGHRPRRLSAAEVAQIAGRAGRGMRDGTFGTTGGCAPIDEDLADAVENHRFEPLEQLAWRNSTLDFTHVDQLLASLTAPPPRPGLIRGRDASDLETLAALARRRTRSGSWRPAGGWCARYGTHARSRIFASSPMIAMPGSAPACSAISRGRVICRRIGWTARWRRWTGSRGDHRHADAAAERRAGLVLYRRPAGLGCATPPACRARARAVEDKLSDALHEKLTARFVDRRSHAPECRRLEESDGGDTLLSAVTPHGEVVVEGHAVGHVAGFSFAPDPLAEGRRSGWCCVPPAARCGRRCPRRVERLEAAEDAAFALGGADQRLALGRGAGGAPAARRERAAPAGGRCWTASSSMAPSASASAHGCSAMPTRWSRGNSPR